MVVLLCFVVQCAPYLECCACSSAPYTFTCKHAHSRRLLCGVVRPHAGCIPDLMPLERSWTCLKWCVHVGVSVGVGVGVGVGV